MKLYKTTIEILTSYNTSSVGITTLADEVFYGAACCVTYDVDSVDSSEYGGWTEDFFGQLSEGAS